MKINIEKEDVTTSTISTKRFYGPFFKTETNKETTHIKLYSTDSNTFSFSLTPEIESQQPLHQLEHVIIDEHLVSNETCTLHLTNLLSNIYNLQPSTKDYIIRYISAEAINWKKTTQGGRGSKIEINVKENLVLKHREISLRELSSELSCMVLGCSDKTRKNMTCSEHSHVSNLKITTEEIKGCVLEKGIFTRELRIKTRSNNEANSFGFSLNYEKKQKIHHGNLNGHKIKMSVKSLDSQTRSYKNKIEYIFPDQFYISKETCDHILFIVLSEIDLSSKTREYFIDYLSREAVSWDDRNEREGIIYEINVKDNVDLTFEVESCSAGEENDCSSRILTARMRETECAICLKGLLGEVRCMELSCSHLFHKDCVMTWLKNHSSCPLCRKIVDGQVAFIC